MMGAQEDLENLCDYLSAMVYRLKRGDITPEQAGDEITEWLEERKDAREDRCVRCGLKRSMCHHDRHEE